MTLLLRLPWVLGALLGAQLAACGLWDERSQEEKGRDFTRKNLDFVQGAAEALEEKGKGLGKSLGKGFAEAVRGAGSAMKDTLFPTVPLATGTLRDSIRVLEAHEGKTDRQARRVVANLHFQKNFHGRVQVLAFSLAGTEIAKSKTTPTLKMTAGETERVEFEFPKDTRFSHVAEFQMRRVAPRSMKVASAAAVRGIKASQFSETVEGASVYVSFDAPFRGALYLRAYDAGGTEIGRSRTELVFKGADSADYFEFTFAKPTKFEEVARYELYVK